MPDFLVLFSTLGGLSLVGITGFVLGPVIAALFIAVWHMYTEDREREPDSAAAHERDGSAADTTTADRSDSGDDGG
jgi:predicted PurR-regulated permease PerM